MADTKQLTILEKGVGAWNEWRDLHSEVAIDLQGANLSRANLSGINFLYAKLIDANFCEADLHAAEFSAANLLEANLRRAKLTEANFSGANLSYAKFIEADLKNADLFEVQAIRTDFTNANMAGALLRGASFGRVTLKGSSLFGSGIGDTAFAQTSLKDVTGLENCEHLGPCAIDYHTLIASGPLPEVFLRGCGFSDEFIRYIPSFQNTSIDFYSCFISYSHADKAFARRLYDALQGRGVRCWLDEHQLLPGDQIHRHVDEAIRLWDKVLLCCSKTALESWWVDKEIQKALMKEELLWKERGQETLAIIPLNLDGQRRMESKMRLERATPHHAIGRRLHRLEKR